MPAHPPRPLSSVRHALLLGALLVAGACSGGDNAAAPTDPAGGTPVATTGSLALVIGGLPPDVRADVLVTGPNGFSRVAEGSVTWADLPNGSYTVTVRAVRTPAGLFGVAGAPTQLQVAGGSVAATVAYAPVPVLIEVVVGGVPASTAVPLRVVRPDGRDTALAATRVVTGPAGRWQVEAAALVDAATRFAPAPARIDTTLRAGDTARVALRFVPVTGALAVAVSGLPSGIAGRVRVRGPGGFSDTTGTTRTFTMLAPGRYTVVTAPVTVAGVEFRGAADSTEVVVEPSAVAAPAPVMYVAQVGGFRLETTGLVAGSSVPVTLTGNGVSRSLTAPGRVDSLPPGSYTLSVAPTVVGGLRYAPVAPAVTATILPAQSVGVTLAYELLPTILDVAIDGLATNTAAKVTLTAPNGETFTPVRTQRFLQAPPGTWTMAADTVTSLVARHAPTPLSGTVSVAAGDTGRINVQYAVITGSLAVAAVGLPPGAWGAITVTGPDGYSRAISGTTTLTHLRPGTYTVTATEALVGGIAYAPATAAQQVTVAASLTAAPATVSYVAQQGDVAISATGLPPGTTPAFTLAGPATRTQQGTGRVSALPPGSYVVTAGPVDLGGIRYVAAQPSVTVVVTAGGTATAHFDYTGGDGGTEPNVVLRYVSAVQAVQTPEGTVPLVAGRQLLLRAFITANSDTNRYAPRVTFRLFDSSGTQIQAQTVTWQVPGVKTFVDGGRYDATLNMVVDSARVRPGLRILAELDPASLPVESRTDDNVWPRGGTPQLLAVSTPTPFVVRFIPVTVGGATGNVSTANLEQYLSLTRQLFPIRTVQASVRAAFTSTVTQLTPTGSSAWSQVLSEVNALRTTDGAEATAHYYGVVKPGYGAGIAGVGYVPGRSALGWDDGGTAAAVAAHEWGHNFGRSHAPCGTSGDGQYPYAGGIIGHFGWIPGSGTIVPATHTDIMGYCDDQWVSDYTWNAVLAQRASANSSAPARGGEPTDGLLVWGRVSHGEVVLEPAFRVRAPLTPQPAAGTHRLELLAADGASLGTYRIRPTAMADGAEGEQHFALVVPVTPALEQGLATIRVRDVRAPLRSASRTTTRTAEAAAAPGTGAEPLSAEPTARGVRVRWQTGAAAMAMVRDAASGEVLGFVRNPGQTVGTGGRRVEVVYSDGVRSTTRRPQ